MGDIWKSSNSDRILNGLFLGLIIGLLVASSSIPFIVSSVQTIVNYIPVTYHFEYIEYVVMGIIGVIVGGIIDKY